MKINFYSGPHCCLCDDAKDLLSQLDNQEVLDIVFLNVRDDPHLYHLYGARIPVIQRTDTLEELGWPFDLTTLQRFIYG